MQSLKSIRPEEVDNFFKHSFEQKKKTDFTVLQSRAHRFFLYSLSLLPFVITRQIYATSKKFFAVNRMRRRLLYQLVPI